MQQDDLNLYPRSLSSFKKILIDCIDMEINSRQTGSNKMSLSIGVLSLSSVVKIHTAFTSQGIETLNQQIFADNDPASIEFRDFFLSLCDSFFISIEGQIEKEDCSNYDFLVNILSTLDKRRAESSYIKHTLLDESIVNSVYSNSSYSDRQKINTTTGNKSSYSEFVLSNNDWLIVVMLIVISNVEITNLLSVKQEQIASSKAK